MNQERRNQIVEMIREKNPKAVVVTTPISQLTGAQLLEIIEQPMDDMAAELLGTFSGVFSPGKSRITSA